MKKLLIIIMCAIIGFSSLHFNAESVQATGLGYATVISVEQALASLMGAFGVGASNADVYSSQPLMDAWYNSQLNEFVGFAKMNYDITQENVKGFWNMVRSGVIDQGNMVWTAFKDWVQSLRDNVSHGGSSIGLIEIVFGKANEVSSGASGSISLTCGSNSLTSANVYFFSINGGYRCAVACKQYGRSLNIFFSGSLTNVYTNVQPSRTITTDNGNFYIESNARYISGKLYDYGNYLGEFATYQEFIDAVADNIFGGDTVVSDYATVKSPLNDILVPNIGLANKDDVIRGQAIDGQGQVFIDWGKSIDIIEDLPNTIAQAIEGSIAYPMDDVLGLTIPFDLTTDRVITQEGVSDKTITDEQTKVDDKPISDESTEDKTVEDFTISGLGTVFPFCIPFDFVNIVKAFNASPEAPRFVWNVPSKDNHGLHDNEVVIDLAPFDGVARVFRTCELVAFVIGLLFLTRKIIFA